MNDISYTRLIRDGLWSQNTGLVPLLGLCPLLAVSTTVVSALGLGLATTLVLTASNATVSLLRPLLRPEVRIVMFMLVIGSFATVVELAMNAFWHPLYTALGIFVPLLVTNCVVLSRAEAFASKTNLARAALDGLARGLGFTLVLVLLGGIRELLGQGTLLGQAHLLFGEAARGLTLQVLEDYRGFLLVMLPPGAFIGLGLLIALKNKLDSRRRQRASPKAVLRKARF